MGETKADDAAPDRAATARHLAEQGLQQPALCNDTEAERLFERVLPRILPGPASDAH